jgi:hypothetical protein
LPPTGAPPVLRTPSPLGYHWDIQYDGQVSGPNDDLKNLKVDPDASKLWVVNPDAGARKEVPWIGDSLKDLEANPELAELAKKATPVWVGPGGNPNLPAAWQWKAVDRSKRNPMTALSRLQATRGSIRSTHDEGCARIEDHALNKDTRVTGVTVRRVSFAAIAA